MSSKMQVLFVKQTGHVLAAFTRTADPEGAPNITDLIGSGLLVRNTTTLAAPSPGGEILVVPPEPLNVAVVDYDPDVFISPLDFVAGGGRVSKLGPNVADLALSTDPIPPPPPPQAPTESPPLVHFSTQRVTVQLDGDATDDKGVCVVLQEAQPLPGNEPERRVAHGSIKSGTHFVSLDLKATPDGPVVSIDSKDFFIMALIAGYRPLFGMRLPAP
ncbi:MAG TPA: hypothetical protein VE262_12125 [Blastocatellia bacterium]|nr:hypothetical protein [Blastocatellia bacterium]